MEINEMPLIQQIWATSPGTVKVAWVLLFSAFALLIIGAIARGGIALRRRRVSAASCARGIVLVATALCLWGLGGLVIEAGNSLSHESRAEIFDRITLAQCYAFQILQYFVPLAIFAHLLSYLVARPEVTGDGHSGNGH
jgi:hypothetical protein